MKATDQIQRYDRRKARAVALTAALMRELDDVLDHDRLRDVSDRLYSVLYANGVSLITDEERARMGLEPRDDLGWTPSERVAAEQLRIETMQMLAAGVITSPGAWPKLPTES